MVRRLTVKGSFYYREEATEELFSICQARRAMQKECKYTAIVSGSHGKHISPRNFNYIFLIATGYGVETMLAYMKRFLLKPHTNFKRLVLIWEHFNFHEGKRTLFTLYLLTTEPNRPYVNDLRGFRRSIKT